MYSKIINPKTGRNVTIYGKVGQQILRNYITVQQGGSSKCTNYHTDPIKCQASKYCVYSAAKTKGVVGQCRKSSAKDVEKSKESARRRDTLEQKFQEAAARMVQKRFRRNRRNKLIDKFTHAVEDLQTREQTTKSIKMAAQIAEDMRKSDACKSIKKKFNKVANSLRAKRRFEVAGEKKKQNKKRQAKLGTKPNSPPPPPPCFKYRKGKCRETSGCMLTKGKKKKCVPCDTDKCLNR